jgi:cytochrome c nitrite reductase small subunit
MESTEEALPGRPTEQPLRRQARAPKSRRWILIGVAVAVGLAALFVGTSLITDRPEFCATCHEMQPYVDAWATSTHKDVWCVDCHVGQGYPARFAHKFVALGEVVSHFKGDVTFPRPSASHIADKDCSACHAQIKPKLAASGFDHATHQSKAACQVCHAEAGHVVTDAALTAVGVFNPNVVRVAASGTTAVVGHGSANVAGHVKIACTRCHNMKKTGCPACHATPAKHFQPKSGPLPACPACHKAGAKWAFTHPSKGECQTCHTPSAKHFKPPSGKLTPCVQCHAQAGKAWTFSHPTAAAKCTNCHAVPAKHFKPASASLEPCSQCHAQVGASWKFSHPGSKSDCESCHSAPSGHSAGQCSQCHSKTGRSFSFSHPSSGAPHGTSGIACNKCHPNGYSSHSCTCH